MKKILIIITLLFICLPAFAQEATPDPVNELNSPNSIFDDKMLLDGYTKKYSDFSKEIILEMIKDNNITAYKSAAAVRVFKQKYSQEMFGREKILAEKILLKRLNRDGSPFVQVEVMHALCRLDRYKFFTPMVPVLIQKLDHYNTTVNEMTFNYLNDLIQTGNNRQREARIVFNTLNKILFLSRNRLATMKEPTPKLKQKLQLLRWSIKVLGNQELKRLPKEVLNLL